MTETRNLSPEIKNVLKGGGIGFVGYTAQAIFNIAFMWYLARTLGAAGLGVYTLAFSFVSIMMVFALLGMDRAIVKFVAHYIALGEPEKARGVIVSAFRIFTLSSFLICLTIFWGADFINAQFYREPDLVPAVRWMSIYMIANGLVILLVNIPIAFQRVEFKVLVEQVFLPIGKLLLAVSLVFILGSTLLSFVYSTVFISILAAGLALWCIYRFQPYRALLDISPKFSTNKTLKFSTPLVFTQLLNRTGGQLSFLLLGSLATMTAVGIYRVASRITLPMNMIVMATFTIFSPIIASLYAKGEIEQLAQLYRKTTRWMLIAALPIFLVLILIPEEILSIFGDDFVGAAGVLILIGAAQLVNVATGSAGAILQMTKYVSMNLINAIITLAIIILLQLHLIPTYGLMGAAIADFVGITIINLLRLAEVFFLLHIHPFNRTFAKPIMAAILTGIISYWWNQYSPEVVSLRIVAVIAFVFIVYSAFLWLLKLNDTDREIVDLGRNFLTRKWASVSQSYRKGS